MKTPAIRSRATLVAGLFSVLFLSACRSTPQAQEAQYLDKGKALLAKKDPARALLEFRNASKAMPKAPEPYYQMGLVYLQSGNAQSAVAAFRKAISLDPKHDNSQLKLAEMMVASQNKDVITDGETRLEGVLARSPGNIEASNTLAMAEFQLGKRDAAMARLEDTLRKNPAALDSAVNLARLKMALKDNAGAEEVLNRAVASAPKSLDAALALAQFYLSVNQPDKAEPEIRRALAIDPNNGPALSALGTVQLAGKRNGEADQTYRKLGSLPDRAFSAQYGVYLYSQGRKDDALKEFKKQADADPNDRAARGRLLGAYVDMGKVPEAQKVLDAVIAKNSKDTDALFQRAKLYETAGKPDEATKDLRQVLHNLPNSGEAHLELAGIARTRNQPRTERQELNEALRLNPNLILARVALSRNFIDTREGAAALQVLDQAPADQKRSLGFAIARNWALLATANIKELQASIPAALQAARVPELVLQDAIVKFALKDYAGARTSAEEVLKNSPGELRAARLIVDSYTAQKEPAKAGERLRELVATHSSAPLDYLLGQWYMNNGQIAEARKALEDAKTANPKFVEADLALAQLERRDKRDDLARARLDNVLKVTPKNPGALLMLAGIEQDAGNHAGSIARYRDVLNTDGANVYALNNLAYELAREKPDEALGFAQHAAEIAPDNPTVEDTLGWVYYRKGIYKTAVNYLKQAVTKDPTPVREYHLALCYMKNGDEALGQKTMQAALRKDPDLAKTQAGW